jgi:hypothetical protein
MGKLPSLRRDPRLAVTLNLQLKNASIQQLIDQLGIATGLSFTVEQSLADRGEGLSKKLGDLSTTTSKAWAIMELLVGKQAVPAHWQQVEAGYHLVPSSSFGRSTPWIASYILLSGTAVCLALVGSGLSGKNTEEICRQDGLFRQLVRWAWQPIFLVMACSSMAGADTPSHPAATLARIANIWKGQASEIVTADIEINLYRYYDRSGRGLGRDAFLKDLQQLEIRSGSLPIEHWNELLPDKDAVKHFKPLPTTILINRSAIRNESALDINIFDGQNEVRLRKGAGGQVSLYSGRSNIALIGLPDLRLVPPLDGSKPLPPAAVTESPSSLEMRFAQFHIRVDPQTGFVYRFAVIDPQGLVSKEVLQFHPTSQPRGIVFPSVRLDISYSQDCLKALWIYEVVRCRLNGEITPEQFLLGVPKGTTVVDMRRNRDNPPAGTLPESVSDVLTQPVWRDDEPASLASSWFWFWVGNAGLVVILIGAYVYRRSASRGWRDGQA